MSIRYVVEIREDGDNSARRFAFRERASAVLLKGRVERSGGWASEIHERSTAEIAKEMGHFGY